MNSFEEYIYHAFEQTISSWSPMLTNSIYALSFYIDNQEDDPRFCSVTLGYNTYEQWQSSTPEIDDAPTNRWPTASDRDEAKWNYAFWLQNQECIVPSDEKGIELRRAWLEKCLLWYSDEDAENDFDAVMAIGEQIVQHFTELCIQVSQQLHGNGIIYHVFSRNIPILVHQLEYYDEVAKQTHRANPAGVTQEFEEWIAAM